MKKTLLLSVLLFGVVSTAKAQIQVVAVESNIFKLIAFSGGGSLSNIPSLNDTTTIGNSTTNSLIVISGTTTSTYSGAFTIIGGSLTLGGVAITNWAQLTPNLNQVLSAGSDAGNHSISSVGGINVDQIEPNIQSFIDIPSPIHLDNNQINGVADPSAGTDADNLESRNAAIVGATNTLAITNGVYPKMSVGTATFSATAGTITGGGALALSNSVSFTLNTQGSLTFSDGSTSKIVSNGSNVTITNTASGSGGSGIASVVGAVTQASTGSVTTAGSAVTVNFPTNSATSSGPVNANFFTTTNNLGLVTISAGGLFTPYSSVITEGPDIFVVRSGSKTQACFAIELVTDSAGVQDSEGVEMHLVNIQTNASGATGLPINAVMGDFGWRASLGPGSISPSLAAFGVLTSEAQSAGHYGNIFFFENIAAGVNNLTRVRSLAQFANLDWYFNSALTVSNALTVGGNITAGGSNVILTATAANGTFSTSGNTLVFNNGQSLIATNTGTPGQAFITASGSTTGYFGNVAGTTNVTITAIGTNDWRGQSINLTVGTIFTNASTTQYNGNVQILLNNSLVGTAKSRVQNVNLATLETNNYDQAGSLMSAASTNTQTGVLIPTNSTTQVLDMSTGGTSITVAGAKIFPMPQTGGQGGGSSGSGSTLISYFAVTNITNSLSFNIPTTNGYLFARIIVRACSTNATSFQALNMQLNGDTGANYDNADFQATAAATSVWNYDPEYGLTLARIGTACSKAAKNGTNEVVQTELLLPVTGGAYPSWLAQSTIHNTASFQWESDHGEYKSTVAISNGLLTLTGSAFNTNSSLTVLGVK